MPPGLFHRRFTTFAKRGFTTRFHLRSIFIVLLPLPHQEAHTYLFRIVITNRTIMSDQDLQHDSVVFSAE